MAIRKSKPVQAEPDVAASVESPSAADTEAFEPEVPEIAAPAAGAPEQGQPCRFQPNRDLIVDAIAFGIDPETGIAERVEGIINGRFERRFAVRQTTNLAAGRLDGVGCFEVISAA